MRPTHGAAFVAFAEFLEALCAAPQVKLAHVKPVLALAKRARTHAAAPSADGPHLVHTVNADALTQFAALAERVKPHTLTVVSPFHHHEGAPVRTLVEALGVATLRVVVAGTTSFPFDLAQGWSAPATPVRLAGEERRLHAKLYEAKGDERLVVLTGSVNATHTALKSNDNVEVGVVRTLPLAEALQVEALAAPPMFKADIWEPGRGGAVVAATLTGSEMHGRLFDAKAPAGTWMLTLQAGARTATPCGGGGG